MPPSHDFVRELADHWPSQAWCEVETLVAVSGGADSVALLRGLVAMSESSGSRLSVVHVDHQMRGQQSQDDATFVQRLCDTLSVPCVVREVERPASHGDGFEATLRDARYAALEDVAHTRGARYLATAHTADDVAETVLHRIVRGTGIAGLAGIPELRVIDESLTVVRPLLWATRDDVVRYLDDIDQPFREDVTNKDQSVTRNRIRHELLPHLEQAYNPQVRAALGRLAILAAQAQDAISERAQQLAAESVSCEARDDADRVVVDIRRLDTANDFLIQEMFKRIWREQGWPERSMSATHWQRLSVMVRARRDGESTSAADFPGAVHVARDGDCLTLSRRRP